MARISIRGGVTTRYCTQCSSQLMHPGKSMRSLKTQLLCPRCSKQKKAAKRNRR